MRIQEIESTGAFFIVPDLLEDSRGFFARIFCEEEFHAAGLTTSFLQCSLSFNISKGTLRGLHFQRPPQSEIKLIRCVKGSIFDVIVDLRPDSPYFKRSFAVELNPNNRISLYIPGGFAHGFQCLEDNCEVQYQMDQKYIPGFAAGLRFDDPALKINWPLPVGKISDQDLAWEPFIDHDFSCFQNSFKQGV